MQSSVQNLEALKREMSVIVPADAVNEAYSARLKEVAKSAKINGFRPGKAPENVIEQKYKSGLLEEIAGKLIQNNFEKAITENSLRVAGQPMITEMNIDKNAPLEFKAVFEVYPEVELSLLDGVEITKEQAEVVEQDVANMLEKIQKQHAEFKVVEAPAKSGDRVTIDFEGSVDGEIFEGGVAKEYALELGSNSMIPGFEDGIVGMSIGDTKSIDVTFPETYHSENLKGKSAVFKIVLHKIEAPELPELNDDLAKKMEVEGGIDALKEKVKEGMQRELKEQLTARNKEAILEKLIEKNSIDVPESLVKGEVQHLKKMSMSRMAQQYGMPLEQLENLNLPDDPYKEQADKRVRLGLLLAEVIKHFDVKPDADRLAARIKEIASHYQKPEEVEAWYSTNPEAKNEIEAAVIEEIAVEKLTEGAKVVDKIVSYDDVVSPANS